VSCPDCDQDGQCDACWEDRTGDRARAREQKARDQRIRAQAKAEGRREMAEEAAKLVECWRVDRERLVMLGVRAWAGEPVHIADAIRALAAKEKP